jgi:enamine deaminase RidA (YjgF/YER057c/UK114 family)
MRVVEGGIEAQTEQVLKNLTAVLKAAGSDPSKVLKTTVFLLSEYWKFGLPIWLSWWVVAVGLVPLYWRF